MKDNFMTNAKILKKVIEKAVENGFKITDTFKDLRWCKLMLENKMYIVDGVILSHEFAKAFWGKKLYICLSCNYAQLDLQGGYCVRGCLGERSVIPIWQYHLQQLVISKYRIKYIGGSL